MDKELDCLIEVGYADERMLLYRIQVESTKDNTMIVMIANYYWSLRVSQDENQIYMKKGNENKTRK